MKTKILAAILPVLILIAFSLGFLYFSNSTKTCDNAVLKAQVIPFYSNVSGTITELNIQNNTPFKNGEIIAKIDDKQYQKALDTAQNEYDKLKKELNNAQSELNQKNEKMADSKSSFLEAKNQLDSANSDYIRYKNEYKDGSVTKKDLSNAIENLKVANSLYEKAQKELENNKKELNSTIVENNSQNEKLKEAQVKLNDAKLNLSYTTIIAKSDCLIINSNLALDKEVEKGEKLFDIVANNYYVEAIFADTSKIKAGQKARIIINNHKIKGTVEEVKGDLVKIAFNNDISKYNLLPKTKAIVKIKLH